MPGALTGRLLAYLSSDASPDLRIAKLETGTSEVLLNREDLARLLGSYRSAGDTPCLRLLWRHHANELILVGSHWIASINVATGETGRRLSSEEPIGSVEISPDGHYISFLQQGRIHLLDLNSGHARPLTSERTGVLAQGAVGPEIQDAFEMPEAYWWAPDSSAIAYLQTEAQRFQPFEPGAPLPSMRLWVCNLRDRQPHPVDLGTTSGSYVPRVNWLPDSKRLAVQVLDREQTSLSVLLAYSSSRPPTLLFKETDPYWINVGSVLHLFADGTHLLWSSERSGYRHLEVYDLQAHVSRAVTAGAWEVTGMSYLDEAAHQVYFTGTLSGPAERQLYRVSLDGRAAPTRLTASSGTHRVMFAPNGTGYVDTWSDVDHPPVRSVYRSDGSLVLTLDAPKKPEKPSCPPQFLTIRTHEGARLDAMLIRPPGVNAERRYPVIIEINGEPRHQVVRNAWDGPRYTWHQAMAERGYVVLALDCHGSGGQGHRFEEPLHYRLGAQEMSDLRDAVDWLRRLPYVDASRIGAWGSTYNGFLALEAILTDPGQIKAAVAESPIVEWKHQSAPFAERYLGLPQLHHEEYEKSSPLEFSERFVGKLLVVTPAGSGRLREDLEHLHSKLAKTGGAAQFVQAETNDEFFEKMTEFFLRNL